MLLFFILSAVAIAASAFSLLASVESRKDIASGNPKHESLADVTGILDRGRIEELVGGRADDKDRYTISAADVAKLPRSFWVQHFDNPTADVVCIVLTLTAVVLLLMSQESIAWLILATVSTYTIAGYFIALVLCLKHRQSVWPSDS